MWSYELSEADLIDLRFSASAAAMRTHRMLMKVRVSRHPMALEHGLLNSAGHCRRFAMRFMQLGYGPDRNELNRAWAFLEESVSLRKRSAFRDAA